MIENMLADMVGKEEVTNEIMENLELLRKTKLIAFGLCGLHCNLIFDGQIFRDYGRSEDGHRMQSKGQKDKGQRRGHKT